MKYQSVSVLFGAEVIKFVTATIDYSGAELVRVNVEVNPANFQALLENGVEFTKGDGTYSFTTNWENIDAVKI